ncbi:MAG: hypothetical protein DMF61_25280 [Blastocatellia bacterium AA13]|nr:MAG: hypothetical protein DMF61_25280 [Blastocatellia bacterium AA13]
MAAEYTGATPAFMKLDEIRAVWLSLLIIRYWRIASRARLVANLSKTCPRLIEAEQISGWITVRRTGSSATPDAQAAYHKASRAPSGGGIPPCFKAYFRNYCRKDLPVI